MTVKELIKELQGYAPDEVIAASIWNTDDVRSAAEQNDHKEKLTQEECESVLEWVEAHHDAQYGINWDVLWMGIEEAVIINKKENK